MYVDYRPPAHTFRRNSHHNPEYIAKGYAHLKGKETRVDEEGCWIQTSRLKSAVSMEGIR
jgi:hypothetical protein